MKNLITFVVTVAFLVMSACTQKVDIEAEKAKIKTVVDQLDQVWETENMELYSKIIAHDPDLVICGTDARVVGWEPLKLYVKKGFESYENIQLSTSDQIIKVHSSGNVAWFSQVVDWSLVAQGQHISIEGIRYTGILEKRNGNWLIVQLHTSIPFSE